MTTRFGNGRRWAAAGLLAFGLSASQAGCYGSFTLTRGLHKWNGEVTDARIVHTLLFWALVIIPVYEVAALGDAIILNVIEFWTGENPVTISALGEGPTAPSAMADGSVVYEVGEHRYRFYPEGPDAATVWVDGEEAGTVRRTAEGGLALTDQRGGRSVGLSRQQLAEIRHRLASR